MMARPLEKTKKTGGRYTRPPEIEAAVDLALSQNFATQMRRAAVRDRTSAAFLASECLVHLIRDARRRGDGRACDALLALLLARCAANLNVTVAGTLPAAVQLREEILGDFAELFALDGSPIDKHKLDIFEVRFNLAFAAFRISGVRPALSEAKHQASLPDDGDDFRSIEAELDNEVLARLQDSSGETTNPEELAFRSDIARAIHALPPEERNAIVLVDYIGLKEESDDPAETTAATLAGVTGRTIRNRRTRALAKLAARLKEET